MLEVELVKRSSRKIWGKPSEASTFHSTDTVELKPHVTRVLLVDDHLRVRTGMKNILQRCSDIEIVGEASNGLQALEMVEKLTPDLILLDIEMPIMNGNQVAARLHEIQSPVQILVLSAHDDQQYIQSMLELGASGYLLKEDVPDILVDAVRGVSRGEKSWISRRVEDKIS